MAVKPLVTVCEEVLVRALKVRLALAEKVDDENPDEIARDGRKIEKHVLQDAVYKLEVRLAWMKQEGAFALLPAKTSSSIFKQLHNHPGFRLCSLLHLWMGSDSLRFLSLSGAIYLNNLYMRSIARRLSPSLISLDLSSSPKLTDYGLRHISAFKLLRELRLNECTGLTSRGLSSLIKLPVLQVLELQDCGLELRGSSNEASLHLSKLHSLVSLDLSGNELDEEGLGAVLTELSSLEHISVAFCEIGDGACFSLFSLPRLQSIDLRWTLLTHEGLNALAAWEESRRHAHAYASAHATEAPDKPLSEAHCELYTTEATRSEGRENEKDIEGEVVRRARCDTNRPESVLFEARPPALSLPGRLLHCLRVDFCENLRERFLARFPDLKFLSVAGLDPEIVLASFSSLTKLERLDLSRSSLSDHGFGSFSARLASSTALPSSVIPPLSLPVHPSLFPEAPALTVLNLSHTMVSDLPGLEDLRNLRTLNLSSTMVTDETIGQRVAELPLLADLALNHTAVTDGGLFALAAQSSALESLSLRGAAVTDLCLLPQQNCLAYLPSLTFLDLSHTKISRRSIGFLPSSQQERKDVQSWLETERRRAHHGALGRDLMKWKEIASDANAEKQRGPFPSLTFVKATGTEWEALDVAKVPSYVHFDKVARGGDLSSRKKRRRRRRTDTIIPSSLHSSGGGTSERRNVSATQKTTVGPSKPPTSGRWTAPSACGGRVCDSPRDDHGQVHGNQGRADWERRWADRRSCADKQRSVHEDGALRAEYEGPDTRARRYAISTLLSMKDTGRQESKSSFYTCS